MFDPPPGIVDCEADAENAAARSGPYRELTVDGVGVVHARRPMPNAIPALAQSANAKAKISHLSRQDYLDLFVRNHLADGEFDELIVKMMRGEAPPDTVVRVSKAIATAGTARPT